MAPHELLDASGKEMLTNMIKYFDKQEERRTLGSQNPVQALKMRLASAFKKGPLDTGIGLPTDYIRFGVSGDHFIYQNEDLGPMVFNADNKVVVKLLPRLSRPAQKYHVDQGAEDYV